jgi:hypothetical protein
VDGATVACPLNDSAYVPPMFVGFPAHTQVLQSLSGQPFESSLLVLVNDAPDEMSCQSRACRIASAKVFSPA